MFVDASLENAQLTNPKGLAPILIYKNRCKTPITAPDSEWMYGFFKIFKIMSVSLILCFRNIIRKAFTTSRVTIMLESQHLGEGKRWLFELPRNC